MNEISRPVWARALESLDDATANAQDERYLVTLNRSHHAVFYALTTLLYEKAHLHTKSHSGAHAKFRELYIKTGIVPVEASTWLDKTWELRQAGDYDFEDTVTAEEAVQALEAAHEFLEAATAYLHRNNLL